MPWNNTPMLKSMELAEILWSQGMNHLVFSPGSRNAPLTLGFSRFGKFKMHGVPDERTAGFVALGLRDSTRLPVAVITTSGSAVANLYPSVCEAFFREKEIVLITADRPEGEAGNWTGQTIFQRGIFGKHIAREIDLDFSDGGRSAGGALRDLGQIAGAQGPIHINVHFSEPFYPEPGYEGEISNLERKELKINKRDPKEKLPDLPPNSKLMMLFGQNEDDLFDRRTLQKILDSGKVVMVRDVCSNVPYLPGMIATYDLWGDLDKMPPPNLLLSFGRSIVSKKFRNYLAKNLKKEIHFGSELAPGNPFGTAQKHLPLPGPKYIPAWFERISVNAEFIKSWKEAEEKACNHLETEMRNSDKFSEPGIVFSLIRKLPEISVLHLSNSLPVRYVNFFQAFLSKNIQILCNRGTSGIDGSMSTAIGAALGDPSTPHFLLIGDQAFFYDVNALWQPVLPENLTIFMLNNGGGAIFETIHGPSAQPEFKDLFFSPTERNAEFICKDHALPYQKISNTKGLEVILGKIGKSKPWLNIFEFQTNRTANLESLNRINNL
jgi:2-succinyl-5-enolpyruvyl-6-hydroxy-3-cyclohexene-1-carboxylate synthase